MRLGRPIRGANTRGRDLPVKEGIQIKVVLFCGGLGLRMYPNTEKLPKALVNVGNRPILSHLMEYYSHFGHTDFILCLGYKADQIKKYFINYDKYLRSDFTLTEGGKNLQILDSDVADWRITFADTGLYSNIAKRLKTVEKYVEGEEMFLANYSDVLTDLHLPLLIDSFVKSRKIGCFLSVKPPYSFHIVSTNKNGLVKEVRNVDQSDIRINGGFFAFRKEIFTHIDEGEDLVPGSFHKLIDKQELIAYKYDGFWACMDTFKEKQQLDEMYSKGAAPWEVWKGSEIEKK